MRVEGDPHQLSRLVRNLVDNATRHARSTIGLRLYAEDGQAVIEVADDGAGVPPAERGPDLRAVRPAGREPGAGHGRDRPGTVDRARDRPAARW